VSVIGGACVDVAVLREGPLEEKERIRIVASWVKKHPEPRFLSSTLIAKWEMETEEKGRGCPKDQEMDSRNGLWQRERAKGEEGGRDPIWGGRGLKKIAGSSDSNVENKGPPGVQPQEMEPEKQRRD